VVTPCDAAVEGDSDDIETLAERLAAAEHADEELDEAAEEIAALEEALELAQAEAEEAGAAVDAIDERLRAANSALAAAAAREASTADSAQARIMEMQMASALEKAAAEKAAVSMLEAAQEAADARCAAAEAAACRALADAAVRIAAAEGARTEALADAAHAHAAALALAQADAAAAAASASCARGTAAQSAKALASAAGEVIQLRRRNAALEARGRDVSARMAALMRKVAAVGGALSGSAQSYTSASEAVQRPAELLRISAEVELLALEAAASGSGGSTAAAPAQAGEADVSSGSASHRTEGAELVAQLGAANQMVARLTARVAELEAAAEEPMPPRRSRAEPGLQESLRMATDQVVSRAAALLAAATQPEVERVFGSDFEESSESAPGSPASAATPSPVHPWRRGMALLSHAHEMATMPEPVPAAGEAEETDDEADSVESEPVCPDSVQSVRSSGSGLRATDAWAAFYLTM